MSDKNEEIWVNKFDEESADKFRKEVFKQAKLDPSRPVIIYIDSYGGLVDSLAKMIETMDEIPNPTVTVCMGKAMSCGAILFSHGDVRYCGKHSRVMVHEVSSGTFGDVHDMHADSVETKRLNTHFLGLLAKNCGIKGGYEGLRKIIKDRDGRDMYLDAKHAVEFGIADRIGIPMLGGVALYEVLDVPHKKADANPKRSKYRAPKKPKTVSRKTTRRKTVSKKTKKAAEKKKK